MVKKYFNKFGVSVVESVGIMMLITSAIIGCVYFLKNKPPGFLGFDIGDRGYGELIKKDRAQAELVMIGRITGKSAQTQEGMNIYGDPESLSYGFVDFAIDSIERGHYPYDKINVYFGWASNLSPPQIFPWGTKKDYKVGDRVRVFLYYGVPAAEGVGPDRPCYFTGLAYLSLEPLETTLE